MDQPTIITLLQKHFSGQLAEPEKEQLMDWLEQVDASEFNAVIDSAKDAFPAAYTRVNGVSDFFAERLEARVNALEQEESEPPVIPLHRIHFLRTAWVRYAAAIILLFGIGTVVYLTQQKKNPSVTHTNPVPVQNDVAPGGNKAILTLADGTKIILDSAANGMIAKQGNSVIEKKNGAITYLATAPNEDALTREGARQGPNRAGETLNTMSTPRGGQYQLTLPDGSQVWLNAESSITYPTAFTGKERRVSITGEAYFEVAKDKTKPFKVSAQSADGRRQTGENKTLEIEVLGTHFNVNTYNEEPTIKTTLLEGSVRLTSHRSPLTSVHTSLTLQPGQQGQWDPKKDQLSLAVHSDVEEIIAWTQGKFHFESADLKTILRQFERWYDIQVVYEGPVSSEKYFVIMNRNATLSSVLKSLQANDIQFRIEGKKLFVGTR
jgi:transmembrane sensor